MVARIRQRLGIRLDIRLNFRTFAAALATFATAAGAYAAGPAQSVGGRFDEALDRYERGHYAAAFEDFAALADDGHCEAARIAHQMASLGRALCPVAFEVAPGRLQRWQRREGCPPALAAAQP